MVDEVKLTREFWKANETPLTAANLNLMTNAIVDNATAIEKLGQTVEKIKPKVYTFKNHYYFPSVGEEFVSKIVIDKEEDEQGIEHEVEHETGGPLYLDLSTNKLYKWKNGYEFFDYAIEGSNIRIITCGGAN